MKILELFLGILTAVGGFVEIGEMVFMSQAGAHFGFRLLWVVALRTNRRRDASARLLSDSREGGIFSRIGNSGCGEHGEPVNVRG